MKLIGVLRTTTQKIGSGTSRRSGQQLVAIRFAANGYRRAGAGGHTTSPPFLKTLMLPLESEHVSGGCL